VRQRSRRSSAFLATLHEHINFVAIKLADRRRRAVVWSTPRVAQRRCGHGRRFNGLYWNWELAELVSAVR